jgi:hypothetical protein
MKKIYSRKFAFIRGPFFRYSITRPSPASPAANIIHYSFLIIHYSLKRAIPRRTSVRSLFRYRRLPFSRPPVTGSVLPIHTASLGLSAI